jgi:hypothetical protein
MFSKLFENVKKFIPGVIAAAVIVGGVIFYSSQTTASCVNVVIDYGVLDLQSKPYEKCLDVEGQTTALELMTNANFKITCQNQMSQLELRVMRITLKVAKICQLSLPIGRF